MVRILFRGNFGCTRSESRLEKLPPQQKHSRHFLGNSRGTVVAGEADVLLRLTKRRRELLAQRTTGAVNGGERGLGHYRMRGMYTIEEQADYDAWLTQETAALTTP